MTQRRSQCLKLCWRWIWKILLDLNSFVSIVHVRHLQQIQRNHLCQFFQRKQKVVGKKKKKKNWQVFYEFFFCSCVAQGSCSGAPVDASPSENCADQEEGSISPEGACAKAFTSPGSGCRSRSCSNSCSSKAIFCSCNVAASRSSNRGGRRRFSFVFVLVFF